MSRLALLLVCSLVLAPPLGAELAVFTDGRILQVEDAYLEQDEIVLLLDDHAWLRVPATRIDRVVTDEVEVETEEMPALGPACRPEWHETQVLEDVPFAQAIVRAAKQADLSSHLLACLVRAESNYDPLAESSAGARGLTQLMPAAAVDHQVVDVWDPEENLRGGAAHLRRLLDRFSELPLALAAYNAGAATVEQYQGVPPYRETQHFVAKVMHWFCGTDQPDAVREDVPVVSGSTE